MSKAATSEALQELHDAVAKELKSIVTNGRRETRKQGDDVVEVITQASAADLSAAINFLARNKIECAPGKPSAAVKELASSLPFPTHPGGEEDAVAH